MFERGRYPTKGELKSEVIRFRASLDNVRTFLHPVYLANMYGMVLAHACKYRNAGSDISSDVYMYYALKTGDRRMGEPGGPWDHAFPEMQRVIKDGKNWVKQFRKDEHGPASPGDEFNGDMEAVDRVGGWPLGWDDTGHWRPGPGPEIAGYSQELSRREASRLGGEQDLQL